MRTGSRAATEQLEQRVRRLMESPRLPEATRRRQVARLRTLARQMRDQRRPSALGQRGTRP